MGSDISRVGFAATLASVLLVGMVSAGVNPMLALYLIREANASSLQLSAVLAGFNLSGLVASLGLGALADRRGSLRQVFVASSFAACGAYLVLALFPTVWISASALVLLGGPALAVISLLFGLLRSSGLSESQMMYCRAAFSVSWILGPAAGTFLVDGYGFGVLFATTSALSVISMTGILLVLPGSSPDRVEREVIAAASVDRGAPAKLAVWIILTMIVAFVCLKAVNSATVSFLPILTGEIWEIDLTWAGTALGLCAAFEVVVLALLGRFRNFGLSKPTVIGIGAACGLIYAIGLVAVPTIGALLVLQVFNAVFIATMSGAGMTWFQDLSGSRPGLMTAIYMNTARLGAIVAAPVLGLAGVGPLIACAALVTAGGLGVAVVASRSRRGPTLPPRSEAA